MKPATRQYYRQKCQDGTYEDAVLAQYNIVQLKFDGIWCACEVSQVEGSLFCFEYYSRNNKQKLRNLINVDTFYKDSLAAVVPFALVGELMYGTQRSKLYPLNSMVVFDLWSKRDEPYVERFHALRKLVAMLPQNIFTLCPFWPLTSFHYLWEKYVANEVFEGVVFRKLSDTYEDPCIRQKLKITADYICAGFIEGQGKYQNTLGALRLVLRQDNTIETTAAGMDDEMRDKIWNNKEKYQGQVCELEGSGYFESGILRHPQFKRWRFENE